MTEVTSLACIFDTKTQSFAIELVHGDADERVRFAVAEPAAVEALLDAYDDCSAADFDAETGELAFTFDEVDGDGEADEDEDEDGKDEIAEDEEEPARAAG